MPVARHRVQWRPLAAAFLSIGMVVAACSTTDSEPIPTTTTTTTTTAPATTSSSTTTTTVPFVEIEVQVDDDPEVAAVLSGFYTWVADRDAPQQWRRSQRRTSFFSSTISTPPGATSPDGGSSVPGSLDTTWTRGSETPFAM